MNGNKKVGEKITLTIGIVLITLLWVFYLKEYLPQIVSYALDSNKIVAKVDSTKVLKVNRLRGGGTTYLCEVTYGYIVEDVFYKGKYKRSLEGCNELDKIEVFYLQKHPEKSIKGMRNVTHVFVILVFSIIVLPMLPYSLYKKKYRDKSNRKIFALVESVHSFVIVVLCLIGIVLGFILDFSVVKIGTYGLSFLMILIGAYFFYTLLETLDKLVLFNKGVLLEAVVEKSILSPGERDQYYSYEYTVRGKTYSGTGYCPNEGKIEGEKIRILYHPTKHNISCVEE
ncbi:MAG: hypothetical protein COV35_08110 [Alphaproteobacteria bacterium CG11_big_fil_rev_8_21_14_0_20_39_49]|nr:MAG: hypothetical protein COV35_08110 [Alphaproteobacteria bacterium CG11_big_fil_rev_8_21_14_0_20_39_49]